MVGYCHPTLYYRYLEYLIIYIVKLLNSYCCKRPPVLKEHISLAEDHYIFNV